MEVHNDDVPTYHGETERSGDAMNARYDVIVIGSGIGGLACAAALARFGKRVLVLEQHYVAGGFTHTFSRQGYTWDVGVHYLGQMGPGQPGRKLLDWLTGGAVELASMGEVYDTALFPDGFRFDFRRPADQLAVDLKQVFPECRADIDRWFAALRAMMPGLNTPFVLHAAPRLVRPLLAWLKRRGLRNWWGRTTAEVLAEYFPDPRLRALLAAQWGDYGGTPNRASFGMHATIVHHYLDGGWYPAGGAAAFAEALIPVIEGAGGTVRVNAPVACITLKKGRAVGVELADSTQHRARSVVSDAGARTTLTTLLPQDALEAPWGREVMQFQPSISHVSLYLGFDGDIFAAGASRSNTWIYHTWDHDRALWQDPFDQPEPPMLFVSFPSLKDPRHTGDKHTAEVITWVSWDPYRGWEGTQHDQRPQDYEAYKDLVRRRLLEQFNRYFPRLAPMIRYDEISTPLSTLHFTRHERGAVYGLETTPARFLSRALHVKTPVPGLYLSGQDVCTPGVMGAMAGGVLAASAIDPRIFAKLPR